MLTIAQISAAVACSGLVAMPERVLADAAQTVVFAIDPAHLGEEPHLRFEIDACALDDAALHALDQAIWAERAARENARWAVAA